MGSINLKRSIAPWSLVLIRTTLRESAVTRSSGASVFRICRAALLLGGLLSVAGSIHASAVYQYSVLEGDRRVYLWVPPSCNAIRGLIVAFKNLTEQRWLEDPIVRGAAKDECLGVVWIGAGKHSSLSADMSNGAGTAFLTMQQDLARISGFAEIANAPIIPTGHSAQGQFAWKFAEWAPERTIAAIPIKTVPLPRDLDLHGVPILYIVGQTTEWPQYRDGRIGDRDFFWPVVRRSALALREEHNDSRIAVAVDPGGGHFDWSERLARLIALYIRTACALRLPRQSPTADNSPSLRALPYDNGWLLDSAGMNPDRFAAAPVGTYAGNANEAYWVFDRNVAQAIDRLQGDRRDRKKQMLSFEQDGRILPVAVKGFAALHFEPAADDINFTLHPVHLPSIPPQLIDGGAPLGHADEPIHLSVTTGPVEQTGPFAFRFALSRESGDDGWIEEKANQTSTYRKAVQPGKIHLPGISDGVAQTIHFEKIAPQKLGAKPITLRAISSAGLPVRFYIVSGPATIDSNRLTIAEFPQAGAHTIEVIVTAYQQGTVANGAGEAIARANPVVQRFEVSR